MTHVTLAGFVTFSEEQHKTKFLKVLAPLTDYVKEHEPETLTYSFMESADDPLSMVFVEVFASSPEAQEEPCRSELFLSTFLPLATAMMETKEIVLEHKVSKTAPLCGFWKREV